MKKFKVSHLINLIPLTIVGILIYISGNRAIKDFKKADEAGNKYLSERCEVVKNSVYDGDTLQVNCSGSIKKIRLCGIDAPEKQQEGGIASRDYLRSLLNQTSGDIAVVPVETDRYGRLVAELFVATGRPDEEIHVNSQMAMAGWAYHYAQYSSNCPNKDAIAELEAIAQEEKLGVWANPNAIKPWEWRKKN